MPVRTFTHHRDVPPGYWRWSSFSPAEIACRGTGRLIVHEEALDALQALRDRLGKPMVLNSAYRSPEHNTRIGGAPGSKHMEGHAFDVNMANHDPAAFEDAARACGFRGFGFYPRQNFMHIDMGPSRTWGERFPAATPTFSAEATAPRPAPITAVAVGAAAPALASAGSFLGAFDTDVGKLIALGVGVMVAGLGLWLWRTGRLSERVR